MTRCETRTALVTDVTQGAGSAIARLLEKKGFRVFAPERLSNPTQSPNPAHQEEAKGNTKHRQILNDLDNAQSISAACRKIENLEGQLDLIVALPPSRDGVEADLTVECLRAKLEAGVMRTAMIIDTFLPLLKVSNQGRIVVISSADASMNDGLRAGMVHGAAFRVSMAAVNALTQIYARQLAPHGIKVNAVAPDVGVLGTRVDESERVYDDVARLVVQLGTTGMDGPIGGFFTTSGTMAW